MARTAWIRLGIAGALAALAAGGALALTAAGAGDDGVFGVTLADGELILESEALAAGRHVVAVANEGSGEHELVVVRTGRPADRLPVGLHGVSIRLAGELVLGEDHLQADHVHPPGAVVGLRPGESSRHQIELEPGR